MKLQVALNKIWRFLVSKSSAASVVVGSGAVLYLGGGVREAVKAIALVRLSIAVGGVIVCHVRQTVPFTGRKHAILVPAFFEVVLGQVSFQQYMAQATSEGRLVPESSRDHHLVGAIAEKIIKVLQRGMGGGHQKHLEYCHWQHVVVTDKVANAFVLPGGKIVVHTGLLDLLKRQEDMVAMVLAHEVAHTVARHGIERMGMGWMFALLLQAALQAILAQDSAQTRGSSKIEHGEINEETKKALQMGEKYFQLLVALPFSRKHEAEADLIGLKLMTMAGYDSNRAADTFRLLEGSEHKSPAESVAAASMVYRLGCTHPKGDTRVKLLEQELATMATMKEQDACNKVFTKLSYLTL